MIGMRKNRLGQACREPANCTHKTKEGVTTMKQNVNISINWKTQEIADEGVNIESHRETLADDGFARAVEMIAEGFREGELHTVINTEDGEREISGYWRVEHSFDLDDSQEESCGPGM